MNLDRQMKKLADGDRTAFGEIYEHTKNAVYYTALSVLKERSLAEDVMQSAYLKVIKNAAQYRLGTNAVAWILGIAKHEALNLLKSRSREQSVDVESDEQIFGTAKPDEYGILIDIARRSLPDEEFEILMLVVVSGYKRREIAKMLGTTVSTVTRKYGNALQKMRKLLDEQEINS